jgi:hypothetical protein
MLISRLYAFFVLSPPFAHLTNFNMTSVHPNLNGILFPMQEHDDAQGWNDGLPQVRPQTAQSQQRVPGQQD